MRIFLVNTRSVGIKNKNKMCPLPAEKKAVQSEGLHSVALERHYSVPEVATLWGISEKTVRRLFDGEDGVLRWGSGETPRKRRYQNLRIPQSILIRVHHRRRA
jgi:AraC-like DNA-binding protein